MAGMLRHVLISILLITVTLSLTGCGDDRPDKIAKYQQLTEQRLASLGTMLDDGQLRNANLLKQYSTLLKQQKPDLAPLLDELAKDSGPKGPMYTSLKRRLEESKNAANFADLDQQLAEAENLYQAADPSLFNDMLSDPVNVVADMSEGKLARVNAISREAAALANGAEDFGPGSQLVGNPATAVGKPIPVVRHFGLGTACIPCSQIFLIVPLPMTAGQVIVAIVITMT